jgi:uncharacterized protein (DUF302 family)
VGGIAQRSGNLAASRFVRVASQGAHMSYYKSAILQLPFGEAIDRTEAALKEEGFGVISRIDIQDALKSKIGVDFRPYTILGACNPSLAFKALKIEDKVGTMLPCNVIVQASGGDTEVAAIDLLPPCRRLAIQNSWKPPVRSRADCSE